VKALNISVVDHKVGPLSRARYVELTEKASGGASTKKYYPLITRDKRERLSLSCPYMAVSSGPKVLQNAMYHVPHGPWCLPAALALRKSQRD
jgi:hypothetical protein